MMRRFIPLLVGLLGTAPACGGGDHSPSSGGGGGSATGGSPATGGSGDVGGSAMTGGGTDTGGTGTGGTGGIGTGGAGGKGRAGRNSGGRTSGSGGAAAGMSGMPSTGGADPGGTTCGLASPAFCDTFEKPSPGGRGGDLDETQWSFARWGHTSTQFFVRMPASTYTDGYLYPSTFCGKSFKGLLPDADAVSCKGPGIGGDSMQLNEVFDDHTGFGLNSMRIRQPFDFDGRTGTISWEVDGKINPLNLGHGWWIEVWITEDPAPIPYHGAPTMISYPRNGIGFAFQFGNGCPTTDNYWGNMLEHVHVIEDYRLKRMLTGFDFQGDDPCFHSMDAKMNRFRLTISKDQATLQVSDFETPTQLAHNIVIPSLGLNFTRGYVHFQHGQYNASKDGLDGCHNDAASPPLCPTRSQTFRWDNVGFDGPVLPVPRGYDAPENTEAAKEAGGILYGYELMDGNTQTVTVPGVKIGDATSATLNVNVNGKAGQHLDYRLNGQTWHEFVMPQEGEQNVKDTETFLRTFTIPVSLTELVDGDNAIDFKIADPQQSEGVGNIDLTLQ